MRLLILLILLPFISESQIIHAKPLYRPFAGTSCSYLLDQYSGATAAYSLRLLDCDYAGSLIRVRRSSDNAEQDIGQVNGNLDTASLKTFVGTGGTDDGFVVTWYDQSGNAVNATQSTSSEQPQIMDNGVVLRKNGYVAIFSDGSNDVLNLTISVTANTVYAFASASRETGGTSERLLGFAVNNTSHDWSTTAGLVSIAVTTTQAYNYRNSAYGGTASTTAGTRYVIYSYINNNELGISVNNGTVSTASTSSTAMNSSVAAIFSSPWPTTNGYGKFYANELIIYKSDQSSNKSNIISNINTYWGVY